MQFKKRPYPSLVVGGSPPIDAADLEPTRAFRHGDELSLHPETNALHETLTAQVVGRSGDKLLVSALHSLYASPTTCLVRRSDEVEVARDEVWTVYLTGSPK